MNYRPWEPVKNFRIGDRVRVVCGYLGEPVIPGNSEPQIGMLGTVIGGEWIGSYTIKFDNGTCAGAWDSSRFVLVSTPDLDKHTIADCVMAIELAKCGSLAN